MSEIRYERAIVLSQEQISAGIFSLMLGCREIAASARPGQFVTLYCKDKSRLLPRPISICRVNEKDGILCLVYRVAGEGTAEFAGLLPGDDITCMGPLGNGFPIEECNDDSVSFLIGGGIGIPPMLELCARLPGKKQVILGYRDSSTFLKKEFEDLGAAVYIASEDGSIGTKGNVLDAIAEHQLSADVLFACGPKPMLRALAAYGKEKGIKAYVSLEERMACGIGACLACVCKTVETDAHSQVNNTRICTEGPVFAADAIVWQ